MYQLFYWPTPNAHKITLFLEAADLDYEILPLNIMEGEQYSPKFLEISPNNKMPALIDHSPEISDKPISLFESGCILEYLADKHQKFLASREEPNRYQTLQWLNWQMSGFGPMLGQNHHFSKYAPEKIPYAIERYKNESKRLYSVLEKELNKKIYVSCENYTIADMAIYPWTLYHREQGIDLEEFPSIKRWQAHIQKMDSVIKAYSKAEPFTSPEKLSKAQMNNLFNRK